MNLQARGQHYLPLTCPDSDMIRVWCCLSFRGVHNVLEIGCWALPEPSCHSKLQRMSCLDTSGRIVSGLSGPISRDTAILSLREVGTPPKWCDTPPLVLSFTQAHLCDTPFCNISRDNCAISTYKQARNNFAIVSLQVSCDMKSIAIGPLSLWAVATLVRTDADPQRG